MTDQTPIERERLDRTFAGDSTKEIAAAQVHTVLALAEQTRIANLIALYVGDSQQHPAGGEFADACYSLLADSDVYVALRIETT